MIVAEVMLWAVTAYLAIGLMVGVSFVWKGVSRIDPAAQGASPTFRLLILPGSIALWPWIVQRWLQARNGVEHS